MQHTTSVWIHIRIAKHTPNSMVSVLFNALCIQDLKPRTADKWLNCAQFHSLCTRKEDFLPQILTCPECVHLSLVYSSVHETYAERFILNCSVRCCLPYILHKKKTYNTLNIFSVYFPYVWAQLVQPTIASPKGNCTQIYPLCTRKDVSMTHQCNLSRMSTDSTRAI